ncbi:MAG TPA: FtsH protease activity modulator HflK [Caulobacteraceae bacterium]|nr:FtsH protease activity modulator HflK [Caulobacteraceae bacterium]
MPWNDNANPGPWGSPPPPENKGGGPRGPRRPSGGPTPPGKPPGAGVGPWAEYQRRFNAWFRGPDGKPRPRAVAILAGAGAGLFLLSGTYVVQPNEQAVVTTFGAFTRTAGPGLRYHAPLFERVTKVPVTTLQRTDVGGVPGAAATDESLMLTGDENIVDLSFSVTWRVADAPRYVFNIKDPEATVKAVAESAMREIVGRTALQPLISTGRGQVQNQAAELMQQTLDSYNAGIRIDEVQIRNAGPPAQVVEAFREVATAQQNAESAVNVARGEAARIVQAAIGYRAQVTREAAGEAARFNQIYEQYRLAPAVTRERLYIETMQRVLANSNKVIIQGRGGTTAPIVLTPEMFRPRTTTAPAAEAAR